MQTRSRTKRARPPDSEEPSARRRTTSSLTETPADGQDAAARVPDTPAGAMRNAPAPPATALLSTLPETTRTVRPAAALTLLEARELRVWSFVRGRLLDAIRQVRIMLFVHIVDVRKCFRTRLQLQYLSRRLRLRALALVIRCTPAATDREVADALAELDTASDDHLDSVLTTLVWMALTRRVEEYQPLLSKLTPRRRQQLEVELTSGVREALQHHDAEQEWVGRTSWFTTRVAPSSEPSGQTLGHIRGFPHTRRWASTPAEYDRKCRAFDRKGQRRQDIKEWKNVVGALKRADDLDEAAIGRATRALKAQQTEEKLMLCRTRKCRLNPTLEQRCTLKRFMGTCRWSYNQAVAHFRQTSVSKATTLRDLYVTRSSGQARVYPDGMGPPPDWAHETPASIRGNTMRTFAANVRSAFSSKAAGNITHFQIQFKSKTRNPLTMFSVNAVNAAIACGDGRGTSLLSIPGLRDILIDYGGDGTVSCEVQILVEGGVWYAAIPSFVRPPEPERRGGCVALDPGIRTFMTGVDLRGDIIEIGGGSFNSSADEVRRLRTHLDQYTARASAAQHDLAVLPAARGRRSARQWRARARAKHELSTANAKLKNCVTDLHHKACSFLRTNYDTVILPEFRTTDMLRPISRRTHAFN